MNLLPDPAERVRARTVGSRSVATPRRLRISQLGPVLKLAGAPARG